MFAIPYLLATAVSVGAVLTSSAGQPDHRHSGDLQGVYLAANDGHDHAKDHGHEDKAHFEAKTFDSAKDAWSFMTEKVAEAEKLVADKKFEAIHEISEQLGAATHTLEEKSMVTGEGKTKLAAALKQLDKAFDELHHSSEANDADATSMNLQKVKGLMPLVHGLYPAGSL